MGEIYQPIKFWHCEICGATWRAAQGRPPQRCEVCTASNWYCGVTQAESVKAKVARPRRKWKGAMLSKQTATAVVEMLRLEMEREQRHE